MAGRPIGADTENQFAVVCGSGVAGGLVDRSRDRSLEIIERRENLGSIAVAGVEIEKIASARAAVAGRIQVQDQVVGIVSGDAGGKAGGGPVVSRSRKQSHVGSGPADVEAEVPVLLIRGTGHALDLEACLGIDVGFGLVVVI